MNKDNYEIPVDSQVIKNEIDELMDGSENELTVGIDNYLKILKILSKDKFSGDRQDTSKTKEIENSILIYSYLRDKLGAKNGYEALKLIMDRKIDSKVVNFWIDEGMSDAEILFAIEMGYPELKEKIRQNKA
jgi:hypothetical protein